MTETKVITRKLVATDVLKEDHPLNKAFLKFCGDNGHTKRQARKFLQKFPQFKDAVVEVTTK